MGSVLEDEGQPDRDGRFCAVVDWCNMASNADMENAMTRGRTTKRGGRTAVGGGARHEPADRPRAPRMDPAERERMIIERATEHFSSEGFNGSTRDLASKIGVTQSLLFRYFPTKESLVNRVYENVYVERWKPEWEMWLKDRSMPIEQRLKRYYVDYAKTMLNNQWIRILIFAGLRQAGIEQKLFSLLRKRVFKVVLVELYRDLGLTPPSNRAETELEIELVWALHASIFYLGLRRWVYCTDVPSQVVPLVEALVDGFIQNIGYRARRRSHARLGETL